MPGPHQFPPHQSEGQSPRKAGAFARLKQSRAKRKSLRNPTGEMTLVEHLRELRRRILISLIGLTIGVIVGFIWYGAAPFGTAPLGEIIRGPYCSLPPEARASFTPDGECRLLATSPFEPMLLRLKVAALAGIVLSSPVWLSQIWGFITPGLHKKERRFTFIFVTLAVILFVAGAVLAYFIVSVGLEFLLSIGEEVQTAAVTGERYYNLLLALLVIFGVSFEVPLIIVMLNVVGLLEYEAVRGKRQIIIVVIMIFAAFLTPGQEPFSMIILASAITILVEIAFQFCRLNDKRRGRQRPEWMGAEGDGASGPVQSTGAIPAPQPINRPQSAGRPAANGSLPPTDPIPPVEATPSPQRQAPAVAQNPDNASVPPTPPAQNQGPHSGSVFDDVL